MARAVSSLAQTIATFRQEERAIAAVEFALVLPLLLLLYFGSIEAASLFTVDKRINSVSATIGDLVSQWDPGEGKLSSGTSGTLTDYLNASSAIIVPYPTAGLKIVVSLVQVRANGNTRVLWSRANAEGTPKTVGNAYADLDASPYMNEVSRGGCVIAAEASYAYLPLMGQVFTSAINLQHTNYFLPRFGSDEPINLDTTNLARNACTAG